MIFLATLIYEAASLVVMKLGAKPELSSLRIVLVEKVESADRTQPKREVVMGGASRQVPEGWIGRKVEVSLKGNSTTTTGEVIGVDSRGIRLAEEVQPEPYGDGMLEDADARFYPHDSIAQARLS